MKMREISEKVSELKRKYKKLYTNVIWSNLDENKEAVCFESNKGIVFIVPETNKDKVYYAISDREELIPLLQNVPAGAVLEYQYRKQNDMDAILQCAGLNHYANYFRVTTIYQENPYGKETGKRKLLNDMYDPDCAEYPEPEDAKELEELTRRVFDPLTDDVYSVDEWREIIKRKECVVIREEEKIVTYFVWRLEGKKLYCNISLNLGPANYMYNLERKVFDRMWDAGVRVSYAWFNEENVRVLSKSSLSPSEGDLYNAIYIKQ